MTEQAKQFAETCGLAYSAEFVPQSKSRNAKDKHPSINWRVSISKNGRTLTTDYMQGCAHLPHYGSQWARLVVYDTAVRNACETGKSSLRSGARNGYDACQGDRAYMHAQDIPAPALVDVLASLVMDASVIDSGSFEEWASEFGYSADSREAERIYRACLEIALTLRQLIDLDAAREAFQDY